MKYIIWILLGYLSGSILFAYWLPKIVCDVNIYVSSEDGNPGTYNVFQQCGAALGIIVLFLELGKGFVPVYMAAQRVNIGHWPFAFVLAAPVLGHAFPVWNHFKGGKSIAVSFGVLLGLYPVSIPLLLLAGCYLLFSLVVVINPHLMRSIVTFGLWVAGCCRIMESGTLNFGCLLIALLVIGKHLQAYEGQRFEVRLLRHKHH